MFKLKTLIKLIMFYIINFFINPSKKIAQKSLLLIRLDAIGDYVMFRNFIEILKRSAKYKEYKITLLGNDAWKSLALELDSEHIDSFIWIDRAKFEKNPLYRFKKLKEISNQGYEMLVNPTYSRSFFSDDSIVNIINAKGKIGSIGDLSNIKKWQKNISDSYYTKLLPATDEIMFEFYRHKEFFEQLLEEKIDLKKPTISFSLKSKKLSFDLPQNYAILFIGASVSFRKWGIANFVEIGKYLKNKYNLNIVLAGGPTDIEDAKKFNELTKYEYVDMVGKTSLVDFLYIIYNGNLLITNETVAPHLAVALGELNIFVISNGNYFGRFTPYPKEIWKGYRPIYHPEIEKDLGDYKKLSNSYGYGSKLDIDDISVKSVIKKIDEKLGQV